MWHHPKTPNSCFFDSLTFVYSCRLLAQHDVVQWCDQCSCFKHSCQLASMPPNCIVAEMCTSMFVAPTHSQHPQYIRQYVQGVVEASRRMVSAYDQQCHHSLQTRSKTAMCAATSAAGSNTPPPPAQAAANPIVLTLCRVELVRQIATGAMFLCAPQQLLKALGACCGMSNAVWCCIVLGAFMLHNNCIVREGSVLLLDAHTETTFTHTL